MSVDRKGRPVSVLDGEERKALLEQLLGIWHANPRWCLGQLVTKAASIPAGVRVTSLEHVADADIADGLTALSPLDWEIELFGAEPAVPVEIVDPTAPLDQAGPV